MASNLHRKRSVKFVVPNLLRWPGQQPPRNLFFEACCDRGSFVVLSGASAHKGGESGEQAHAENAAAVSEGKVDLEGELEKMLDAVGVLAATRLHQFGFA